MEYLPASLEQLVTELSRLPGIGRRTARRLSLELIRDDGDLARSLAQAMNTAADRIVRCDTCYGFSEAPTCAICSSGGRDSRSICVVEQATDVLLIERAGDFRGKYHVLGGSLSPIDGVDPADLRLRELEQRVDADDVEEVIVATGPTMQGEATASYIADRLGGSVNVTRLARGLPVGVDLEHTDELTIARAFAGRSPLT